MAETMTTTLRVFAACLHHYASGALVGIWADADEAETITLADVHRGQLPVEPGCGEIWCLDLDGFPDGVGEMGLMEAQAWGDAYDELEPHLWPMLNAWVESGAYVACGNGSVPVVSDAVDRFRGQWDSFREYAEELADDIGLLAGADEAVARYFDWDAWTRDLAFDHTVMPAADGGVFVFDNL